MNPAPSLDPPRSEQKRRCGISAIILAGGNSSRMGFDKTFAEVEGLTLIERQIRLLKSFFKEIIIVTNSRRKSFFLYKIAGKNGFKNVKVVQDIISGQGPLGGIYSGLTASNSSYNFVFACDMPFINQGLIRYIIRKRDNYDIMIPRIDRKYHPLLGVYSKNCIPVIEKAIRREKLNVSAIFPKVKTGFISREEIERFDQQLLCLVNINTQDDLAMLKVMKGSRTCQSQYSQR